MQPIYPLRGERLDLRPLAMSDAARHFEIFSNPSVVRFLYEEPMDEATAMEHMIRRTNVDLPTEGNWMNLAVQVRGEGSLIGEVGIANISQVHRHYEVGYVFHPACSGHGYATEATALMVELAFSALGAHRVSGRLDARNLASARVLDRLGMRREGQLVENEFVKGEWTDEAIYAVLEREWRARRGPARDFGFRA